MAVSYTYNTMANCGKIYRATTGGTVFSASYNGTAAFDYFTDTAVVNDAIYFCSSVAYGQISNLAVDVGTAIAGTGITGVWEYLSVDAAGWETCHDMTDPTVGFTVTGAATIVFPIQAGSYYYDTINGQVGFLWVRYRITAITTITEGGANANTAVTCGDGKLNVLGGTDATPATFLGIYNWLVANAPEVGATNPMTSVFTFPNVVMNFASVTRSNNETIFMGNGSNMPISFAYMWAGTLVGTDGWTAPSNFLFCTRNGGNPFTHSSYTRFYGCIFGTFNQTINGRDRVFSAYFGMTLGTFIGCTAYMSSGYFSTSLVNDKCTVPGHIITFSYPAAYPTNLRISNPLTYIIGTYLTGGTIVGIEYALPSLAFINWNQGGAEDVTINVINIKPNLSEQTAASRAVSRSSNPYGNLLYCYYYDASAGTFTDYTTACNNATVDDVPLSGDTNDCWYFHKADFAASGTPSLSFTITPQSNGYVYVWEYYRSGAWGTLSMPASNYDATGNLTQTGKLWFKTLSTWAATTINTKNVFWIRLRVVTPGTGSPTFSKCQAVQQTGIGDWRVYEKLTTVFRIVDKDGAGIANANVAVTDAQGNTTNLTTTGNELNPTVFTNAWGAVGASSVETVASGDCSMEYVIPSFPGYVMCGLSVGDANQNYAEIDFCFYTYPSLNLILMYENGTSVGSYFAYETGKVLKIAVEGGVVKYYYDGILKRTGGAPSYPLRVDAAMFSIPTGIGELTNVKLNSTPVTWQNVVGAEVRSGYTNATDFKVCTVQFDPTVSDANYNIAKVSSNPYTITVSKSGYKTFRKKMTFGQRFSDTVALEKVLVLNTPNSVTQNQQ